MEKILIGTPVIDSKDYSIPRWLKSIKDLRSDGVDIFLVDNSDNQNYMNVLQQYCLEARVSAEITHINMRGKEAEERLAEAREVIRQKVLTGGYSRWLSWECDILVPEDALSLLMRYQEFPVIRAIPKSRYDSDDDLYSLDFGLFKRELLEKFEFRGQFGKNVDPQMPKCYHGGDIWFIKRIEEAKYPIIEIKNLFEIEHLNGN